MEISYATAPEASQQEAPVVTGLTGDIIERDDAPLPSEPINLAVPDEAPKHFVVAVSDDEPPAPEGFAPVTPVVQPAAEKPKNARDAAEEKWHQENEAKRKDFMERYYAARKETASPRVVIQPVAPAVAAQTLAEQEAGRKMNEHHAGLRGGHPTMPLPDPTGAKTVPVFRPADYTQPPLKTDATQHAPTRTAKPM